jgi:hypothetical protein
MRSYMAGGSQNARPEGRRTAGRPSPKCRSWTRGKGTPNDALALAGWHTERHLGHVRAITSPSWERMRFVGVACRPDDARQREPQPRRRRTERQSSAPSTHWVRYVAIGGVAALVHNLPLRATVGIDVTPSQDPKNLERLPAAFDGRASTEVAKFVACS